MKRQRNRKTSGFLAALMSIIMIVSAAFPSIDAFAAVKDYGDGIKFDAEYYTSAYSDVHAAYGDDETALLGHY
ncbi:MAG: hypothetical protein K6G12_07035, partial [Lachnospiraceae bacterium]|nr:hypothetical protein [Lachnospiraceae bacterium]